MKRLKEFQKDAFTLGVTGVGLGIAGGLGGGAAVGKLSSGLGVIATLTTAKHGMGIVADMGSSIKKKRLF